MRKLCLLVVAVPLLARCAVAICADPQPRLVCAEYFQSEVVTIAKLIRKTHVTPKNEIDGFIYEMRTAKVLRGKIIPSFSIYEENSSGRASFGWKTGKSYLLFMTFDDHAHAWELDGCGNSSPLKESAIELKAIRRIQAGRKGVLIQGAVISYLGSDPQPGVRIQVMGNNQRFRTLTNDNGEFRIHVPAGEYALHPVSKGWSFVPDEFSYEDPVKINIENGTCAQVQFRGTQRVK